MAKPAVVLLVLAFLGGGAQGSWAADATIASDELELQNNGEVTIFRGHVVLIDFWVDRLPDYVLPSIQWFGSLGLLPAGLGIWAALSGLAAPGTLIAVSSAFCAGVFLLGLSDRRIRAVE